LVCMGMDLGQLEGIAVEFYRRHKLDPSVPVDTFRLARLEGLEIRRPLSLLGARPGTLMWIGEKRAIAIRKRVPLEIAQHVAGHELAHRELGQPHDGDPLLEQACDYLGACLMLPAPAVASLHREYGWRLPDFAEHVVATQTLIALRLAEALRVPAAVVSPERVRVRGPEAWVWPAEREIRHIARRGRPGLQKVRITDQPARCALFAEDLGA
jgi:hypothetical protein